MNKQLKASLLLLLTAFIWGCAFVAQKEGLEYVGTFTLNGVRSVLGALVLLPLVLHRSKARAAEPGEKKKEPILQAGLVCGIFLFGGSTLQQMALGYTSVAKGGFITTFYILLVPVFAIFLGRRLRKILFVAVPLSLMGLYLLCMKDGSGFEEINRGDVLLLFCAVSFSFQILAVDHYAKLVDGVKLAMAEFMLVAIFSAPFIFAMEKPTWAALLAAAPLILYTGVLSSGVGYTLQIIGQKDAEPTTASLIMSLESVFAALAGAVLINEVLTGRELLGCALMFAAVILAQLPERKKT